jgi:2-keto-4-pentenoate hydratase/2-oxohepta-3-ene-1,7-dioic acid hydratase in catechol pathway
MRIVRYQRGGEIAIGEYRDDGSVTPLGVADLVELMDSQQLAPAAGRAVVPDRLLTPVAHPGKILCAGINYVSHKDENPGAVMPESPFFFSKLPTALIGDGDPILIPEPTSQVDYEVELAVIIGRRAKRLTRENALGAVFGYTVANDVSGRDIQFKDAQITLGKGCDSFCPLGPVVVTADEVPDPQDLEVFSRVNGETRQSASTQEMVFTVAELLVSLSRYITLEPGDIVTTGTPAGVGTFRQPPVYLAPGDVVTVGVTGVAELTNPVLAGW